MTTPARQPLPWQLSQWRLLSSCWREGRPPHAVCLAGPKGLGKLAFARSFSQSLLCRSPRGEDGMPCGECRACVLFAAGTHPDLCEIMPAEEGKAITVDQIRALSHTLSLKPQYGGYKIVILAPADALNRAAANSLLKTLEEPAGQTLLLLVTSRAARLPATVRSRCQSIQFAAPPAALAQSWLAARLPDGVEPGALLELANGAPLAALTLHEQGALAAVRALREDLIRLARGAAEPVGLASSWLKSGAEPTLYWMYQTTQDAIRLQFEPHPPRLASREGEEALVELGRCVGTQRLFAMLDRVAEAIRFLSGSPNHELLLEDLAVEWSLSREGNTPGAETNAS